MKTRNLELECLEDRCLPSSGFGSLYPHLAPETGETSMQQASASTGQPDDTSAAVASSSRGPLLGLRSLNHSQTLLRDRRRRADRGFRS